MREGKSCAQLAAHSLKGIFSDGLGEFQVDKKGVTGDKCPNVVPDPVVVPCLVHDYMVDFDVIDVILHMLHNIINGYIVSI